MSDVLAALLRARAVQDHIPIDPESLASYFRTHVERGISQLQDLPDLMGFQQLYGTKSAFK